MRVMPVKYNDFDSKGKRKNGDTLPLNGGAFFQKVGINGKSTLTIVGPVETIVAPSSVPGVAIIFDDIKEQAAMLSKIKTALG